MKIHHTIRFQPFCLNEVQQPDNLIYIYSNNYSSDQGHPHRFSFANPKKNIHQNQSTIYHQPLIIPNFVDFLSQQQTVNHARKNMVDIPFPANAMPTSNVL